MTSVAQTLNFVSMNKNEVVFTVNKGKTEYSRKVKDDGTFTKKGHHYQAIKNEKTINLLDSTPVTETAIKTSPLKPLQSEFSINKRFEFLSKFVGMVLDGINNSIIVSGEGGSGKTYSVLEEINNRNMKEGVDYVVVKGFSTPKALYCTLHDNADKIVVFDDCDSILKDASAINILKAALDSYDTRIISWLSRGWDDEYPSSFEFEGQIIFISNMSSEKMDQAVKSRSMLVDLSMSIQDKIERMQAIIPRILPDVSIEVKEAALEFMAAHSDEAKEFNIRTLLKTSKVIQAYGLSEKAEWADAVKYLLVNS